MNYRALIAIVVLLSSFIQPIWAKNIRSASSTRHQATNVIQKGTDLFVADNESRRLEFSADGLRYVPQSESGPISSFGLTFKLTGLASSDGLPIADVESGAVQPISQENEVMYRRSSGLTEAYRAVESGVEQVFSFEQNPSQSGEDVVITGDVATDLQPESQLLETLTDMIFFAGNEASLRYTAGTVRDAAGRELIAPLHFENNQASFILDGAWLNEAAYPVTVESFIGATPASNLMRPSLIVNENENESDSDAAMAAAAAPETMPIWRVQLRIVTNNVGDAGTDDSVNARLNGSNLTWMDYGRDDFERNSAFTYDLVPENVRRLSDITQLTISKTGSDGLNIRSFTLYVNGRSIYSRDFGSSGRWFDNDGSDTRTYVVGYSTLRANSLWVNYSQPFPPFYIPQTEIESRVEAIVGDFIHDNSLYWGDFHSPRWVEASRKDSRAVHFDLDLSADVTALPDPEVDVDFDLRFSCANGVVTIRTENVRYNTSLYGDILQAVGRFLGLFNTVTIPPISYTLNTGQPVCPVINVQSDGGILFSLP